MSLHNTQCPHCFTTYVISDQQYRVSEGMVRCGTCGERFQARFIEPKVDTPRFDPRDAFIEPLSEDAEKSTAFNTTDEFDLSSLDVSDIGTDIELTSFTDHISESINSDLSIDIDEDAPVSLLDSSKLDANEMLANIRIKQAKEKANQTEQVKSKPEKQEPQFSSNSSKKPDVLIDYQVTKKSSDDSATKIKIESTQKESLIDEVDSLVNDKLLNQTTSQTLENSNDDSDALDDLIIEAREPSDEKFDLNSKNKKFSWLRVLFTPPLLLVALVLLALLLYQLWMKQVITFDANSRVQKEIINATTLISPELEKRQISLPVRRNLSQLELVSARTEAHPTRSSTTLLKVDILNRAKISQPLPWLEMSLSDADGGLVSLRNLSPNDYIYNNNTQNQIGPKELKKITIELLSFPKQATGYEIKLLNR